MTSANRSAVRRQLFAWFRHYGRHDLPWRRNADAWHVLASEVMLQQTQVDRVKPKFEEFVRRWPSPSDLAAAPLADFLRFWSGLGYNRRAMSLHRLAGIVASDHGDAVPADPDALRALPGIGPYTAGAVLAFAHNKDVAFFDTNVRRVLLRLQGGGEFADTLPDDAALAVDVAAWLPAGRSREWYALLMDFGSALCTGRRPKCAQCPVAAACMAAPRFLAGEVPTQRLVRTQSRFEGSPRQVRGAILRDLAATTDGRGIHLDAVVSRFRDHDVAAIVDSLKKEGMVAVKNDRIVLPS
jgi:A/G-specific adenine glycosylase